MTARSACLLGLFVFLSPAHAENTNSPVLIPGGTFAMGCSMSDPDCGRDEGPKGGITIPVSPFKIDPYEVSVAEYLECIAAGHCTRPKDYARNKYCNLGAPGREQHPINCADWGQALAYCEWTGGRLPYEAEWEKAARAGTATRYPWGQNVNCEQAVLDDGRTLGSAGDEPDGCGEDRTWPRGMRAANALGLYDLHGNAGEWTLNWYAAGAIARLYAQGRMSGPDAGRRKVVRGGSWDEHRANLRSSYRNVKPPVSGDSVYGSIGFRCAYDADSQSH